MNKIQREDINEFVMSFALADDLRDSSFLITGGTGLIGSCLIHCLLALNKGIHIIAPVRNLEKAEAMFESDESQIELIECDVVSFDYSRIGKVDYIVHCAAPTSSRFFVEKPVETIDTIYRGTANLLDYAKKIGIKSFVFLSSLEVYGSNLHEDIITENMQGYCDPLSVRSSYPIAKRMAENLCVAYSSEYKIPVKIARLTQTTGTGVAKDDNRVIVQFARLAAIGNDIVLHTSGESAKPYCYTTDCASALLYILLLGKTGEAYNVANDSTYINIRLLGEYVRDNFNSSIKIVTELNDTMGYAPETRLKLDSSALMKLGWKPRYGLKEILERLILSLKNEA